MDLRPLAKLFRASVLNMLQREGCVDDAFIKMIMDWRHNSGFSVHNKLRIQPGDSKGIENLAQYIIRNTFSLIKLRCVESTGTVIYRSKMSHAGNKKNFQTFFSALEFIAAITSHIPERMSQMVRYIGRYSNRMRGDRLKAEAAALECEEKKAEQSEVILASGDKTQKVPQPIWRECIKKVWEVDPLLCPHCAGLMKIISFIHERKMITNILDHLGLRKEGEPKRNRAPPIPFTKCAGTIVEPYDVGWPEYEEPFVEMQRL